MKYEMYLLPSIVPIQVMFDTSVSLLTVPKDLSDNMIKIVYKGKASFTHVALMFPGNLG